MKSIFIYLLCQLVFAGISEGAGIVASAQELGEISLTFNFPIRTDLGLACSSSYFSNGEQEFWMTSYYMNKIGTSYADYCEVISISNTEIVIKLNKYANITKGYEIQFSDLFCKDCVYQLEKEIPYFSLENENWPFYYEINSTYTITPLIHNADQYTPMLNYSYSHIYNTTLVLQKEGPSLELNKTVPTRSPENIPSYLIKVEMQLQGISGFLKTKLISFYTKRYMVKSLSQITGKSYITSTFDYSVYFFPGYQYPSSLSYVRRCPLVIFRQASLDLFGTDCWITKSGRSITIYPGIDNNLEYTNKIDFAAGISTDIHSFVYQQPISTIMQDNDMIYFWNMSKTNKLVINLNSYRYYSGYSSKILQVLSPEGCSFSDYLSDSYTITEYNFTDTAVCSPILFENPYLITIKQRIHSYNKGTFEFQLKVYSVPHQAISSSYKQITGSLFLRFSENIVYSNTIDLKFPCTLRFFTDSSLNKLGSGCRIYVTDKPRELELVFGDDTTLVKGDIVYLANSFCEDCTFTVEKRVPNITYTATNTTEYWNPDITHTVIADVESDSMEFDDWMVYSFMFTEPADNGNKVTNYTITENKIEFEGLIASTFPYVLTIRGTVSNKFFFREKKILFYTKVKENQLHCFLTYQINELLRVTFDNFVPYPDFPSDSEEWGCDLWFSAPSQEILGAGCKVLKLTDEGVQIEVKPGFDTTLKKGDTLNFLDSICAECNITIQQDLPTIRYEKVILPDSQAETLDQVKIYAENYCEEYKMNRNGNIVFPQTTCMKIDFTYEIINPNTGCSTLQLADNNDTYVNIDIQESDLCNVDYDYIFKMKMTLPSGFYREKEFPFYTPIRQKLDTEGVYLEEIGHVIFEFVGQFSDPPITDLTLLFDSATIDLLGDNPVISYYEGADNSLSIMDIVFGSNAKAQKGDQIVFLDSFCRSCSATLTVENPSISCTGIENSYLNIAQPHTISCSISNYNIIEPNAFFYSDESELDVDCQLSLSNLTGLFKENLTFTANSLCLDKDYKMNVQLQIESFVVSKIIQFTTYGQEKQRLRKGEQNLDGTFYFEFSKPLEINSDTCSSINILSESTLSKLGSECAIQTTTGSYNLIIIPDPETTLANGEEITFTSEFCEGCKLTLTKDLPRLTVNYNTSVYYNPTEEHVISATHNIVNSEEANGVINISVLSHPICPAFAALNWGNYNQLTIPPNTLCGDNTEPYIIEITFTVEVNESPEPTFYRKKIIRFYDKETQSITNNIQKPLYYIFEMKFPITVDPTEEITCSDVLDTTTLNLFDATSCQLKVINESSFYLFPGSENNLQIGDNIKFQEEFCPSCQVMITELLGEFNVEPSDSPIWDISIDHTITPGITNYDQADAIIFKFNAIEPTSCTVKDLVISDTIISNPAAVLSTGYLDLCLELYKVNVTMELTTSDGYIFIRHKLISFSTYYQGYSNMEESDGSYLLEFGLDVIYPDESGNTWTCDSYWFKPEIIESLGDGCVVTNIDDRKISLTLGHNTTLQKGDQILFADSFCNGCKIDISDTLPDFLLTTNEELPYWSPTKDYTITSTPINVIGNPIFSYIIEEPIGCNKEIILPDQEMVTISKDVLCVNLEYYILTAKMTLNDGFYREKQIKFITVPLSASCSPLCLGCGANGGCEGCDTSYDHVKEIGSECRCADKWYYNTNNLICQSATNLQNTFDLAGTLNLITYAQKNDRLQYLNDLEIPLTVCGEEDSGEYYINTTYTNIPENIYNLLLSCRLLDKNSNPPTVSNFEGCSLYQNEEEKYTVKFTINLKEMKKSCLVEVFTNIMNLYTCYIEHWFMATENLPDHKDIPLSKLPSKLQVYINTEAETTLFLQGMGTGTGITYNETECNITTDLATTAFICTDNSCTGSSSSQSFSIGDEFTVQVEIDGNQATFFDLTPIELSIAFGDGGTHPPVVLGEQCVHIQQEEHGIARLTCTILVPGGDAYLSILSRIDPVEVNNRILEQRGKGECSSLKQIIGPNNYCLQTDEICLKKYTLFPIEVVEEEEAKTTEGKEEGDKKWLYVGIIIGLSVFWIILLIILAFGVRAWRKRRARSPIVASSFPDVLGDLQTKPEENVLATEAPILPMRETMTRSIKPKMTAMMGEIRLNSKTRSIKPKGEQIAYPNPNTSSKTRKIRPRRLAPLPQVAAPTEDQEQQSIHLQESI